MLHNTLVCEPNSLGKDEFEEFKKLVHLCGEVATNGLDKRIQAAHALALVRLSRHLVGVGAIKNPEEQHIKTVSEESKFERLKGYGRELGWICVHPEHRGIGLGRLIVKVLLREYKEALWATTRENNFSIHKILSEVGFYWVGESYESEIGDYRLLLWVRATSQKG